VRWPSAGKRRGEGSENMRTRKKEERKDTTLENGKGEKESNRKSENGKRGKDEAGSQSVAKPTIM
jgi:hypothetical protein